MLIKSSFINVLIIINQSNEEIAMSEQAHFNSAIKHLVQINKDFETKYDQNLENIEATQRIIIENVAGTKSLVELNYKEIIRNRNEILENRKLINRVYDKIQVLEGTLNNISEKLDDVMKKLK